MFNLFADLIKFIYNCITFIFYLILMIFVIPFFILIIAIFFVYWIVLLFREIWKKDLWK